MVKIKETSTSLILLLGFHVNMLNAELVVSNYTDFAPEGAIGFDASFGMEMLQAVGFTTGTNVGGYQLDSISLLFGGSALGNPGPITIEIYTDDGGEFSTVGFKAPGVQDFTLAGGDPIAGGESVSFEPAVALPSILDSNTTYWAVVRADLSEDSLAYYNWLTDVGEGVGDVLGDGWSISEGASYSYVLNGADADVDGWFLTALPPGMIEIFATAVPEPQTYSLLLSAFTLGYIASRRKNIR